MGKWERDHQDYWRSNNLCVRCGKPRLEGYTVCKKHHDQRNRNFHAKRLRAKLDGSKCISCFGPRDTWRKECSKCSTKSRKRSYINSKKSRILYFEQGRCTRCGHELHHQMDEGMKTCISCREHNTHIRIRRRSDDIKYRFVTGKA